MNITLDFTGTWIMKNGQTVEIKMHGNSTDKDGILLEGVWIGVLRTKIQSPSFMTPKALDSGALFEIREELSYWDNDGKHLTDDQYNLMERPRNIRKDSW